jgi:hypothetical protein
MIKRYRKSNTTPYMCLPSPRQLCSLPVSCSDALQQKSCFVASVVAIAHQKPSSLSPKSAINKKMMNNTNTTNTTTQKHQNIKTLPQHKNKQH